MEDKFDLDKANPGKKLGSLTCHCSDGQKWRMGRGGRRTSNWVGTRIAVSLWICTKAVVCNRQNHMQNFRIFTLRSKVEAVNCVCDEVLRARVGVGKIISLQEAKVLEAL